MALIVADRVAETSATTGTGALTLAAAITGFQRFSAVCATNDTTYYAIIAVDSNGNPSGDWETGLGTYSGSNTLARTTPKASTNGNATVDFGMGTKHVYLSSTAAHLALFMQAANNLSEIASPSTARTNLGLLRLIAFFFTTTPTTSEILCLYAALDAFTIPANMAGSQVKVGTNATSTFAIDVQQNGSTIGTISIATNGTPTLTTTSGASKSIAVGDVLKFVAPSSADATIANVSINIKGTL